MNLFSLLSKDIFLTSVVAKLKRRWHIGLELSFGCNIVQKLCFSEVFLTSSSKRFLSSCFYMITLHSLKTAFKIRLESTKLTFFWFQALLVNRLLIFADTDTGTLGYGLALAFALGFTELCKSFFMASYWAISYR